MATILVVDDRDHEREYLAGLLQHAGHRILEAAEGWDAIAELSRFVPDLVITDLVMPTMDGFEFIRRIRERNETRNTPVVLYTAAYDDAAMRCLAAECTAATILPKPSEPEVVLRSVNKILGEPSRQLLPLGDDFRHAHLELVTTKLHQRMEDLERANDELRESKSRVELALAAGAIGTWDFNPLSGESRWDATCNAAFGLPPDGPATYETFLAALHPHDRKRTAKAVEAALDPAGTGQYDIEYRTIGLHDRVVRHIHARGQSLFGVVGGVRRAMSIIGIVQDITTRKKSEEALCQANESLQQFAYAAAHDLQEPLRNIVNSLALLERIQQGGMKPQQAELIREGEKSGRRMLQMVKGLLAFTQIAEDAEQSREVVDANNILMQVLENLRPSISKAKAQITSGHLPTLHMAPTHLDQLLQNLIENALKYRHPQRTPSIHISAVRETAEWLFTVADNGIGFDQAYAERIFRIFKRLHARPEYAGTGMGLAVCSRIVSVYGGRIWAEGQLGAGATFRFTLPAGNPELDKETVEESTNILLIEDNPLDVELVSYALDQENTWTTKLIVIQDGEEAIRYLTQLGTDGQTSRPDLVLLDLNLPKRDGTEVLQVIRARKDLQHVPVFVLSSWPEDAPRHRLAAGHIAADRYLVKPPDLDAFLALGGALRQLYQEALARRRQKFACA